MTLIEAQSVAGSHRPGEHSNVGDLLSAGASFDLEDRGRDRPIDVAFGSRQQLGDAGHQRDDSGAGECGAEEHGVHERGHRLRGQCLAKRVLRDAYLVIDVRREDAGVVLGEHLGQPGPKGLVDRVPGREVGGACTDLAHGSHWDDRRRQSFGDGLDDANLARSGSIDLVHEDQGRDTKPLQRAHQDAGLRLDALYRGKHEHGAVEHAQHALHLRNEVRVARSVDQIDGDVSDRERHNGGLDSDAPPTLQRQRVRPGGAVVDAAELFDRTGRVEQPFGERRLTGVYMRQDPQVQRLARHASYPPNRS